MSFIKESYLAYKKVQEVLEKETSDHEIAMARSELEGIADKATATSSMLEGMTESGNPLPAWVQSKITNASDYITSVHDYLKYNPQINESVSLEETTFEKIYQMQQDGKSVEDIAKELNLKADLVKKVLGENKTILEGLSDAQIAQLKKEYEPLKGKTITTSQYQQLKNILFKLQDGDLEKLQKQNIPFASTGAGSILRVRKAPVKITTVKVPGLEDMAEEKIPSDYFDYLRTIVYKKIDFYEIPPKQIIQHWKDEPHKDRFKGKLIDYKEGVELQEKPSIKQYVVFHSDSSPTKHKEFKAYDETELNKQIGDFLKQNPGYKVYGKSPSQSIKETFKDNIIKKIVKPIQDYNKKKEDETKKEAVDPSKSTKLKMISIKGDQKEITIDKKDLEKYLKLDYVIKEYLPEAEQLKSVPSLEDSAKKHNVDIETLKKQLEKGIQVEKEHTKDEKTAEKIALAHIDERPDYYVQIDKLEKKPIQKVNEGAKLTYESLDAVKKKAEKTGMPYSILKQVYDRGMAAWKGGHRPGAGQHQWALARVNSFVTKSSGTWGGADSDLAKKVKGD